MVRIYIHNGNCGMEDFFKPISTESKMAVFQACYERESATFRELKEDLQEIMSDSTLAKQLTDLVSHELLEKLVYNDTTGSRTVYRITQRGINILPVFEAMRDFCNNWVHTESGNIFDWIFCTKKLLGSRWNARIIWLLFVLRTVRFNELKSSIEGISFKMLTQQLRYLEDEGVVIRTDFQENPPHIEYSLTEKGAALYEIMLRVAQWNSQYGQSNGSVGTLNNMI